MAGALDGIVVADFSRVLAGPYTTMLMADLGAEVVKIERPGTGDDTRSWGPPHLEVPGPDGPEQMATYFASVNRNKRSVALDLSTDDGRDAAFEIVRGADVVIENFRAGTMERLGLGYDDLVAVKPDLIYCAITGFGRDAGASIPGYDLLIQAMSGLMSITGEPGGPPVKVGVAVVDVLTGAHAMAGILAALRHRDRTGEGQRVDLDLLSVALATMSNQTTAYLAADVVPTAMGSRHPSIVPYEVLPTADRPLAVAVGNDVQFRRFVETIGAADLADDARFVTNSDRVAHHDALIEAVAPALARHGADHWFDALTGAGVPAGPINDMAEAFDFARSVGIDPTARIGDVAQPTVRNPIGLSATPATYRMPPPVLGSSDAAAGSDRSSP
ncbi:CaiB/BaiF CoA transferase family protein [Williamsia deligens]|uniref:CaiB/BaiF CoA transferase family protein n=1 Tax=Williamsia deligens TaxID=321325 RepID=A0ABW3GB29_9NOCA|nr:CoA transferase [Williamsia deligens]MCP2193243.1 Crotonobetainyl-CoA:carnitine CoA-transferase CaiB [Williamsia deligens]